MRSQGAVIDKLASPLVLALMGASGIVIASGRPFGWLSALWVLLLLCGGAWNVRRNFGVNQKAFAGDVMIDAYLKSREEFGNEVFPVWARHIDNSRSQMEGAVTELTGRFSNIVDRLDGALRAASLSSSKGGDYALVEVFANSENELGSVVASIKSAMASKRAMLDQIQELERFTRELKDMAEGVASIAAQTNLLALNAAIEAARAGPAGRGFAVVAREVRNLSNRSAETGRSIQQRVEQINAAIWAASQAAEKSSVREDKSMQSVESVIESVLAEFRKVTVALTSSTEILQRESEEIQGEVSEALVQLQFQDRVSQVMSHVLDNMQMVPGLLYENRMLFEDTKALASLDSEPLLAALQKTYAMAEEHAAHQGASSTKSIAVEADEITFF